MLSKIARYAWVKSTQASLVLSLLSLLSRFVLLTENLGQVRFSGETGGKISRRQQSIKGLQKIDCQLLPLRGEIIRILKSIMGLSGDFFFMTQPKSSTPPPPGDK